MYHLPLLFNRKKTKKPDASAGLAGRWHTALGSGVWEEVAGPEQREANMPRLEGAVSVLTWSIAVLLECKAGDVSSSSFSQKKPGNNNF